MKKTLFALIATFVIQAHAGPVIHTYDFNDDQLGSLKIRVTNEIEPADQPYRLNLTLLCKDNRAKANSMKPRVNFLIKKQKICDIAPPNIDRNNKIMTVHFYTSSFNPGQAECDTHEWQEFNLRELCAEWQH